jgi:hypothetical protein
VQHDAVDRAEHGGKLPRRYDTSAERAVHSEEVTIGSTVIREEYDGDEFGHAVMADPDTDARPRRLPWPARGTLQARQGRDGTAAIA